MGSIRHRDCCAPTSGSGTQRTSATWGQSPATPGHSSPSGSACTLPLARRSGWGTARWLSPNSGSRSLAAPAASAYRLPHVALGRVPIVGSLSRPQLHAAMAHVDLGEAELPNEDLIAHVTPGRADGRRSGGIAKNGNDCGPPHQVFRDARRQHPLGTRKDAFELGAGLPNLPSAGTAGCGHGYQQRRMRSLLERASSLSMTTSSLTRGRLQLEQILSRPTQWLAFLDTAPRGRYQARLSPRRPEWRPTISRSSAADPAATSAPSARARTASRRWSSR